MYILYLKIIRYCIPMDTITTEYLYDRIQSLGKDITKLKELLKDGTAPSRSKAYHDIYEDNIIRKLQ